MGWKMRSSDGAVNFTGRFENTKVGQDVSRFSVKNFLGSEKNKVLNFCLSMFRAVSNLKPAARAKKG
jgi:23S rRNA U2552 (ribose-2'-O)-methylase RlmE/FtsJ